MLSGIDYIYSNEVAGNGYISVFSCFDDLKGTLYVGLVVRVGQGGCAALAKIVQISGGN